VALLDGKFVKSIAKIAMTIVEQESSLSKADSIPQNIYSEISGRLETEPSIKQNELTGIVYGAASAITPIGPAHVDVIIKRCRVKGELSVEQKGLEGADSRHLHSEAPQSSSP